MCKFFKKIFCKNKKTSKDSDKLYDPNLKIKREDFFEPINKAKLLPDKKIVKYHPNNWWWVETQQYEKNIFFKNIMMRPQWSSILINQDDWKIENEGWQEWFSYNGMINDKSIGGHAWYGFLLANKKIYEQEPELLAFVNGKRIGIGQSSKMCLSNLRNHDLYFEFIKSQSVKYPNRKTFSIEPSDGDNFCECDNCKKLGTIPDQLYYFVNSVARKIKVFNPDLRLSLYAYYLHSDVPKEKIEDNLTIAVIPTGFQTIYSPEYMLELWREKFKGEIQYRDYFGIPQWTGDFPRIDVFTVLNRTNLVKKLGYSSMIFECGINLNAAILMSLLAQVWQNNDLSFGDVYEKFLYDCFPKSKDIIRSVFERWWQTWYKEKTPQLSMPILKKALDMTNEEDLERKRVLDLIAYTMLISKRYKWEKNENLDTITEYFEWCYSIGYRNLVNSGALYSTYEADIPTEFKSIIEDKYNRGYKLKDWVKKLEDVDIINEMNKWFSENEIIESDFFIHDPSNSHLLPLLEKDFSKMSAITIPARNRIDVICKGKITLQVLDPKNIHIHIHNFDYSVSKVFYPNKSEDIEITLPNYLDTYRIKVFRSPAKLVIKSEHILVLNDTIKTKESNWDWNSKEWVKNDESEVLDRLKRKFLIKR